MSKSLKEAEFSSAKIDYPDALFKTAVKTQNPLDAIALYTKAAIRGHQDSINKLIILLPEISDEKQLKQGYFFTEQDFTFIIEGLEKDKQKIEKWSEKFTHNEEAIIFRAKLNVKFDDALKVLKNAEQGDKSLSIRTIQSIYRLKKMITEPNLNVYFESKVSKRMQPPPAAYFASTTPLSIPPTHPSAQQSSELSRDAESRPTKGL
ncbi:MAG: hypothetical protein QM752_02855 [Gammaproteobacteria bacterium]